MLWPSTYPPVAPVTGVVPHAPRSSESFVSGRSVLPRRYGVVLADHVRSDLADTIQGGELQFYVGVDILGPGRL